MDRGRLGDGHIFKGICGKFNFAVDTDPAAVFINRRCSTIPINSTAIIDGHFVSNAAIADIHVAQIINGHMVGNSTVRKVHIGGRIINIPTNTAHKHIVDLTAA